MVKKTSTLATALLAALLAGCATPVDVTRNGLRIEPSSKVRHGVSAQGLYEIGRYLQAQERYREAAGAYSASIARAPEHPEVHNALGVVLSLMGNHDAAYASFGQALALTPKAPYLWSNLGYAYFLADEGAAASAALTYGQSLAPADQRISLLLAKSRERFGSGTSAGASPSEVDLALGGGEPEMRPPQETGVAPPQQENSGAGPAVTAGIAAGWQLIQSPLLPLVAVGPDEYELQQPASMNVPGTVAPPSQIGTAALEIANGNGVRGLAQHVSRSLEQQGVATARLTNHKGFGVRNTELQYRVGYEAAAVNLLAALPAGIRLRQTTQLRTDIKVRLVLGKDMASRFADQMQQTADAPATGTPPAKAS